MATTIRHTRDAREDEVIASGLLRENQRKELTDGSGSVEAKGEARKHCQLSRLFSWDKPAPVVTRTSKKRAQTAPKAQVETLAEITASEALTEIEAVAGVFSTHVRVIHSSLAQAKIAHQVVLELLIASHNVLIYFTGKREGPFRTVQTVLR